MSAEQHRRAAIIGLRKPQAAILGRDFDAKGAELRQLVNDRLRDFASAIDFVRINFFAQKGFEGAEKSVSLIAVFEALSGKAWTEIERAQEQSAGKGRFTCDLARRFGKLQGRALAGGHFGRVYNRTRFLSGWFCGRG